MRWLVQNAPPSKIIKLRLTMRNPTATSPENGHWSTFTRGRGLTVAHPRLGGAVAHLLGGEGGSTVSIFQEVIPL